MSAVERYNLVSGSPDTPDQLRADLRLVHCLQVLHMDGETMCWTFCRTQYVQVLNQTHTRAKFFYYTISMWAIIAALNQHQSSHYICLQSR